MTDQNPYAPPTVRQASAATPASSGPRYCGFLRRAASSVIDNLLMVVVTLPLCFAVYGWTYWDSDKLLAGPADAVINYVLPLLVIIGFWTYAGGTPGKLWLGVRIVSESTGRNLTLGQSLVRYLGYIPSVLVLGLGFLWMLWHPKKQCWHDIMAGSVVVVRSKEPLRRSTRRQAGNSAETSPTRRPSVPGTDEG